MDLYEIAEDLQVSPGEYVFHSPSQEVVLCGAFRRTANIIRALGSRGMFEDKIENFKKIKAETSHRPIRPRQPCKGCGKRRV